MPKLKYDSPFKKRVEETNPWKNIPTDIKEHFGFVYLISNHINGRWYIGKKGVYASAGKKGRNRLRKESDWRSYWGSSKELVADIQKYGKENFTREILSVWDTKFDLMYNELLTQIFYDVVGSPLTYNQIVNIRSYIPKNKKKTSSIPITDDKGA